MVGGAPQNLGPQGLVQGLEEHGLIADRDYSILYHNEGLSFGPPELQQERPDIIFAVGSRGVRMAKGATSTVPIIALDLESEPLSEGLIARFSRPGGNLTGLFLDQPAMAAKWLQYLTDTLPGLRAGRCASPARVCGWSMERGAGRSCEETIDASTV